MLRITICKLGVSGWGGVGSDNQCRFGDAVDGYCHQSLDGDISLNILATEDHRDHTPILISFTSPPFQTDSLDSLVVRILSPSPAVTGHGRRLQVVHVRVV